MSGFPPKSSTPANTSLDQTLETFAEPRSILKQILSVSYSGRLNFNSTWREIQRLAYITDHPRLRVSVLILDYDERLVETERMEGIAVWKKRNIRERIDLDSERGTFLLLDSAALNADHFMPHTLNTGLGSSFYSMMTI